MRPIKGGQGWPNLASPKSQGVATWASSPSLGSGSQEQHSLEIMVAHMGRRGTRVGKWEAWGPGTPSLALVTLSI